MSLLVPQRKADASLRPHSGGNGTCIGTTLQKEQKSRIQHLKKRYQANRQHEEFACTIHVNLKTNEKESKHENRMVVIIKPGFAQL